MPKRKSDDYLLDDDELPEGFSKWPRYEPPGGDKTLQFARDPGSVPIVTPRERPVDIDSLRADILEAGRRVARERAKDETLQPVRQYAPRATSARRSSDAPAPAEPPAPAPRSAATP